MPNELDPPAVDQPPAVDPSLSPPPVERGVGDGLLTGEVQDRLAKLNALENQNQDPPKEDEDTKPTMVEVPEPDETPVAPPKNEEEAVEDPEEEEDEGEGDLLDELLSDVEDDLDVPDADPDNPDTPTDHLRERVRYEGQRRKELEKQQAVKDAEIAALEDKLKKLEEESVKTQGLKVDPTSHPDFVEKTQAISSRIDTQLINTGYQTDKIAQNWGPYLEAVSQLQDLPRDEKIAEIQNIRNSIARDMGITDEGEAIDPDNDPEGFGRVAKVLDVFQQHTPDYDDLYNLREQILQKADSHNLAIGYDTYQQRVTPLRETLKTVAQLKEKEIEADPNSIESLAAQKIQTDAKMAAKAEKIDDMLVALAYGPEALSQDALDRLGKTGKDLANLEQTREERVEADRQKYLAVVKNLLVMLPEIQKALPAYMESQQKKQAKSTQKAALGKATKRGAPAKPKEEAPAIPTREEMFNSLGTSGTRF